MCVADYSSRCWGQQYKAQQILQSLPVLQTGVYGYGGSNASSIWGVLCRSLIPGNKEDRDQQKRDILNK